MGAGTLVTSLFLLCGTKYIADKNPSGKLVHRFHFLFLTHLILCASSGRAARQRCRVEVQRVLAGAQLAALRGPRGAAKGGSLG